MRIVMVANAPRLGNGIWLLEGYIRLLEGNWGDRLGSCCGGNVVAGLGVIVTFLLAQKSNQKRAPKTTAPRVFGSQRTQAWECYLAFGSVY